MHARTFAIRRLHYFFAKKDRPGRFLFLLFVFFPSPPPLRGKKIDCVGHTCTETERDQFFVRRREEGIGLALMWEPRGKKNPSCTNCIFPHENGIEKKSFFLWMRSALRAFGVRVSFLSKYSYSERSINANQWEVASKADYLAALWYFSNVF